jgi:hypothetical protein
MTAEADIVVPTLPLTCPDGTPSCVRVDVLRGVPDRNGAAHSDTIPTLMMRMFGISNQGVRATATSQVAGANHVSCIKPFAVADRWIDNSNTESNKSGWDQDDEFNLSVDTYTSTSGFNAALGSDFGLQLTLKGDDYFSATMWFASRVRSVRTASLTGLADAVNGCWAASGDMSVADASASAHAAAAVRAPRALLPLIVRGSFFLSPGSPGHPANTRARPAKVPARPRPPSRIGFGHRSASAAGILEWRDRETETTACSAWTRRFPGVISSIPA